MRHRVKRRPFLNLHLDADLGSALDLLLALDPMLGMDKEEPGRVEVGVVDVVSVSVSFFSLQREKGSFQPKL